MVWSLVHGERYQRLPVEAHPRLLTAAFAQLAAVCVVPVSSPCS